MAKDLKSQRVVELMKTQQGKNSKNYKIVNDNYFEPTLKELKQPYPVDEFSLLGYTNYLDSSDYFITNEEGKADYQNTPNNQLRNQFMSRCLCVSKFIWLSLISTLLNVILFTLLMFNTPL